MIDLELRVKELEEEIKLYKEKLGYTRINKYTYKPADDLLEELGYIISKSNDKIIVYINKIERISLAIFYDSKKYRVYGYDSKKRDITYIDMALNYAIQQKLKELGWLE